MNVFPRQITWAAVFLFLSPALFFAQPAPPPCSSPTGISLDAVSSVSAAFSWSGPTGALFEWEIGLPGFDPGSGGFVFRDSTTDTVGFAFGLASSTAFELYIRAICDGTPSEWSPALGFSTSPGCNEIFTDSGGPLSNYANDARDTVLFCPGTDSQVVQLTFLIFDTELNQDFLKIYDGTDASAPLLASLTGTYLPLLDTLPGPFTASNQSGCLYTLFFSNAQNTAEGWTAFISCVVPDSCFSVAQLDIDSLSANSAFVTWDGMFGAQAFEWKLGIDPFDPANGIALDSGTVTTDTLFLDSLSSNTNYVLYVRSQCDSVTFSDWAGLPIQTLVACGDTLYDSGGPADNYGPDENYSKTICPDSATHTVTLTFLTFDTEPNIDRLSVFQGTNTNAPLDTVLSGTTGPLAITATNATGCLTVQFVSDSAMQQPGFAATVGCDTATDCFTLLDLQLLHVAKDSASIAWTAIFGAQGYLWELDTTDFVPGAGAVLQSDTTSNNSLELDSLDHGLEYFLYVRTLCSADSSDWFGPLRFITPPGCGDNFFDGGGANDNYPDNAATITVICPDSTNQIVELAFTQFVTDSADVLYLYNGSTPDPNLILDTLNGSMLAPVSYPGTTIDGCLTAVFISDSTKTDTGWVAQVNCISNPGTCFDIAGLHIDTLYADTVLLGWAKMFGAKHYEWRIGEAPYNVTDPPLRSDTTSTDSLKLGLTPLTTYTFWIRSICPSDSSKWVPITFTTTVGCVLANNILDCDNTTSVSSSGAGAWLLNCDASQDTTFGAEKVFRFTAPVTNTYTFEVVSATQGAYMDYFYKEASNGCNDANWECIGDFNQPGTDTLNLVAGRTYFILSDPETIDTINQTFRISNCLPPNDSAKYAIPLTVNDPCSSNVYSNEGAKFELGEPNPDTTVSMTDSIRGRWIDSPATPKNTVWFKFVAPPSGTVTVSTDSVVSNTDTQVALYATTDSSDYSKFIYLESDEDNGTVQNGTNAIVYYTGLTPNETYYVQVDGYGGLTGTFCIQVLDGIERYKMGDCITDTLYVAGVDGTLPGGDRWYGLYAGQSPVDLGQLVAAIKPGNQKLDTVFCHLTVYNNSIPVSPGGVPYMPAYFNFSSSTAPIQPAEIRLFFYDYELTALKVAAGLTSATADDLNVTQFTGNMLNCTPSDNAVVNTKLIDTVVAVPTSSTASFYLDFKTKDTLLGEFGAHFGLVVLPIELQSFTGAVVGDKNMLEWVTATEINVQWHIVERAPDGKTWTELGRVPGQLFSTAPQPYQLADEHPLPQGYYRLRSVDFDARLQVSKAIFLVRNADRLQLLKAYPSPVSQQLTLELLSPAEREAFIQVFDLNGRLVYQQNMLLDKGLNVLNTDLGTLPAGMYAVWVFDNQTASPPIRIVKH